MPNHNAHTEATATWRMERARTVKQDVLTREMMLVSILTRMWYSHRCEPSVKQTGRLKHCVCIHTPAGPILWRYSDEEEPLFSHLPMAANDAGQFTMNDKEARLLELSTEGF